MVQNLCKNWLQVSKIIWGIWITSNKQWKVQKLKFNGLHLSKHYIPLAKTYTEDLSNITFNYICENSANSLCHFWNHVIFHDTTHLYYFRWNATYFWQKYPIKFLDFLLLKLKFIKFIMSFFKQTVSCSLKFGSLCRGFTTQISWGGGWRGAMYILDVLSWTIFGP